MKVAPRLGERSLRSRLGARRAGEQLGPLGSHPARPPRRRPQPPHPRAADRAPRPRRGPPPSRACHAQRPAPRPVRPAVSASRDAASRWTRASSSAPRRSPRRPTPPAAPVPRAWRPEPRDRAFRLVPRVRRRGACGPAQAAPAAGLPRARRGPRRRLPRPTARRPQRRHVRPARSEVRVELFRAVGNAQRRQGARLHAQPPQPVLGRRQLLAPRADQRQSRRHPLAQAGQRALGGPRCRSASGVASA